MTGLVTDTGLTAFANALIAADAVKHIGWGGGSGQGESATDLAAAFGESRTAGAMGLATTNTANDTVRITGSITATADRPVTEVGVFSAATGAVMRIYGDFNAVALATNDSMVFTIDVPIDQA